MVVGFVSGVAGWLVTEFMARPGVRFMDLRRETKRLMLRYWDTPDFYRFEHGEVDVNAEDDLTKARAEFADLAAQLVAFDRSDWIIARVVRRLGFAPLEAGRALRTAGMQLGTNVEDRDKNFQAVDHALKFRFNADRAFYDPFAPAR